MDKGTVELFTLFCLDVKTGKKEKVYVNECVFQSANEEKAMFERNISPDIATFEIVVSSTINIKDIGDKLYKPNLYDSSLNKKHYSATSIPKDTDDSNLPWMLKFDSIEQEKGWVNDIMDIISNEMYNQCINNRTTEFNTIGSLCHKGFINELLKRNRRSKFLEKHGMPNF